MIKKIKNYIYDIKRGILNIINWLPVIWKDEDFDHYYFHKIMLHKLKNMEKFFRSEHSWSFDSEEAAIQIRQAVELLERMTNDVYLEEALKPFYEKFPNYKHELEFEPCEDNPKLCRMVNNETEEQKALRSECYRKSDELEKNDYDEFYKFLRENIQKWWD